METKFNYRVFKSFLPVPILSQLNPIHDPLSIPFTEDTSKYYPYLRLILPSGFCPPDFTTKTLYAPLLYPIRAACPPFSFFSI
jgi:hypothetical protein